MKFFFYKHRKNIDYNEMKRFNTITEAKKYADKNDYLYFEKHTIYRGKRTIIPYIAYVKPGVSHNTNWL